MALNHNITCNFSIKAKDSLIIRKIKKKSFWSVPSIIVIQDHKISLD